MQFPLNAFIKGKSGEVEGKLIGAWQDLAAWYLGNDGNVWKFSNTASYGKSNFVNEGTLEQFKDKVNKGMIRGKFEID